MYQKEGSQKDKEYSGFGKFVFVPQDCPSLVRGNRFPIVKKAVYINSGACPDSKSVVYTDIYKEDGTRAFRIAYEELP